MRITEFLEIYYLHDSSLENVCFGDDVSQVTLTINLCNWAQDWYKDGMPENKIIQVRFLGCSIIKGYSRELTIAGNTILECRETRIGEMVGVEIHVMRDYFLNGINGDHSIDTITLFADSVEVEDAPLID